MKKLVTYILFFTFLTTLAHADFPWPWLKKKETVQVQKQETREPATIKNAREIIKELNGELQTAKLQNNKLKESLEKANLKVTSAKLETNKVQIAADKLKEWGIVQQAEKFKWMEKYEKAVKRYHRLKLIASVIAAAAGIFLGLQFMSLVPPPYNLSVPVGGAVLFSSLVWFLL